MKDILRPLLELTVVFPGLPGCFQKLLTDIDTAAVRHAEGGILKIGSILHIDDRAAAADEKARVFFERRSFSGGRKRAALYRRISGYLHGRLKRHGRGKGASENRYGLPSGFYHHLDRPCALRGWRDNTLLLRSASRPYYKKCRH